MNSTASLAVASILIAFKNPSRFTRKSVGVVAALLAGVLLCATTRADDLVWTNTTSGNWNCSINKPPNSNNPVWTVTNSAPLPSANAP